MAEAAPAPATPVDKALARYEELTEAPVESLRDQPGYQFALDEGLKSVNAAAGLKGLNDSGARAKDLLRYGTGFADQTYARERGYAADRLDTERSFISSLVNGGQWAANADAQAAANMGANVSNAMIYAGEAGAGGLYGAAEPWAGALGEIGTVAGNAVDEWLRSRKGGKLKKQPVNNVMASFYG
jgi:hypothetical protein